MKETTVIKVLNMLCFGLLFGLFNFIFCLMNNLIFHVPQSTSNYILSAFISYIAIYK